MEKLTRETIQERTNGFLKGFQDWRSGYIEPAGQGAGLEILDAYTGIRRLALQMLDYCDSCANIFEEDEKGDFHFTKTPEALRWLNIIADACYGCSILLEMVLHHDAKNQTQCYNAVAAMSELIAADFEDLFSSMEA